MPPKFQSSFIPRGPIAATMPGVIPPAAVVHHRDLVSFVAKMIFALSIILALGATGYKLYLSYSLKQMGAELETLRASIATGETSELIRLNDRIVTTQSLLDNHRVLSPLFAFLESSTPKSVGLTEFTFTTGDKGPEAVIKGAAKSYSALALEASVIGKDKDFTNPVFSDIRLDEKGNVIFTLKSALSNDLLSYVKTVTRTGVTPPALFAPTTTPVVATTTLKVATTTVKVATSTATSTKR